ncbi:unnamed protein product [Toxocara canis]|uniref:Protein sel-1-like protein 1 n=1 Tax=Toxocara canis TaxID=6265 RepID=A0A183UWZ6_TOXCA|nr:unnamed protein product [Toxocara canis]
MTSASYATAIARVASINLAYSPPLVDSVEVPSSNAKFSSFVKIHCSAAYLTASYCATIVICFVSLVMMGRQIRLLCAFLLVVFVSFSVASHSANDGSDKRRGKTSTTTLESSETDEETSSKSESGHEGRSSKKQTHQNLDISDAEIESMARSENEESENLSAGDEYTSEGPSDMERELSPSEKRAEELYRTAVRFLDKGRSASNEAKKAAYRLLDEAAQLKHKESMKLMAFAYLFGDYTRWNIGEAREIFEELAAEGSADAQLGLAFLHGTGVGVPESSQAKALIYYTFSALAGNPLAQMALGYRYWSGISVPLNCERALTWYKKVATRVAEQVRMSGGTAMQRIRLPDEQENTGTSSASTSNSLLDPNLLNYYKYLADKGDLQAQVGLGQLYMTGGRGVEQNMELASQYFSTAAEAGSTNAYAYLGKMYLDGTSATPQDNATAFQFFKKAADKVTFLFIIYIVAEYLSPH